MPRALTLLSSLKKKKERIKWKVYTDVKLKES